MKSRFSALLASVLISTFAFSSTALARPEREHRPRQEQTLREKARAREVAESIRAREKAARERREQERRDLMRWKRLRAERAEARRREIYARWNTAVHTPQGRAEFELYAQRMARLSRIRDIAIEKRDNSMLKRCDFVIEQENARHLKVLSIIIAIR